MNDVAISGAAAAASEGPNAGVPESYVPAAWRTCAASVRGRSHVRENLPCQDAHAVLSVPTESGQVLVAVVSDGAGSAARGGEGASFLCTVLADTVAEAVRRSLGDGSPPPLDSVIAEVRTRLLEHAEAEGSSARQFACTLLCAVLASDWAAFAQVGDGVIVTPGDDEWMWIFWPQRGEYANSTSFITDENAMRQLEVEFVSGHVDEIAILTDGLQHLVLHYETRSVHSPFFEKMMAPVRASAAQGVDAALNGALASYLSSAAVADRADDDLTLLLATRREHHG